MSFFTALTNPRSTFRHLSASSMVACRCPHLIRPPASTQCSASSLTCYGFLRGPRKAERTQIMNKTAPTRAIISPVVTEPDRTL
jgi:hypothetical protein